MTKLSLIILLNFKNSIFNLQLNYNQVNEESTYQFYLYSYITLFQVLKFLKTLWTTFIHKVLQKLMEHSTNELTLFKTLIFIQRSNNT